MGQRGLDHTPAPVQVPGRLYPIDLEYVPPNPEQAGGAAGPSGGARGADPPPAARGAGGQGGGARGGRGGGKGGAGGKQQQQDAIDPAPYLRLLQVRACDSQNASIAGRHQVRDATKSERLADAWAVCAHVLRHTCRRGLTASTPSRSAATCWCLWRAWLTSLRCATRCGCTPPRRAAGWCCRCTAR